jgi:predicted Zn-dependent peptidase
MLTRAKRFLIGSYLLQHERLEDRAYYLGYSEIAMKDLGGYRFDTHYADAVNAVTAADIRRVTEKYFAGAPVISLTLPGDPNAGGQKD